MTYTSTIPGRIAYLIDAFRALDSLPEDDLHEDDLPEDDLPEDDLHEDDLHEDDLHEDTDATVLDSALLARVDGFDDSAETTWHTVSFVTIRV